MTLLGETQITSGKISFNKNARLCYAPQGTDLLNQMK
jgi:hypothetical protein